MQRMILNVLAVLLGLTLITSTVGCRLSPASTTTPSEPPVVPSENISPAVTTPLPSTPPSQPVVVLSDPTGDLFDIQGNKAQGEPFMDMVSAELALVGEEYTAKIDLAGSLPSSIASPGFIEWDLVVDSDRDPGTGWFLPTLFGDIGVDYRIFLGLQGDQYSAAVYDTKSNSYKTIQYKVDSATVELHFPKSSIPTNNFNYTFVVRKYAKSGDPSSLVAADKAPNQGHCNFPAGCSSASDVKPVDTDNDGFTDDEETTILNTDPKTAEKWDDLDTVTNILNTPAKINLYLKRKFTQTRMPSQLFAESVTDLFKHKSGDCDEYARLALYWLSKNGYEAYLADIYFNQWWQEYNQWLEHDICVYKGKEDGLWYSFDIYDFGHNPKGPFKSVDEIISQLPSHYGATDWNKYILYNTMGGFINQKTK
jgi:hypothetical protein